MKRAGISFAFALCAHLIVAFALSYWLANTPSSSSFAPAVEISLTLAPMEVEILFAQTPVEEVEKEVVEETLASSADMEKVLPKEAVKNKQHRMERSERPGLSEIKARDVVGKSGEEPAPALEKKQSLGMRGAETRGPSLALGKKVLDKMLEGDISLFYREKGGHRSDLLLETKRVGENSGASSSLSALVPSGGGTFRAKGEPYQAKVGRDGRIEFKDNPNLQGKWLKWKKIPLPIFAGKFDVTDALMKQRGEMIYSARKMKLMEDSREARIVMAKHYKLEALLDSIRHVQNDLQRIWNRKDIDVRKKRALYFELWDECAGEGDAKVMETSKAIRQSILSFIKKEMSVEGPYAYSQEELALFNKSRTSVERFSPY